MRCRPISSAATKPSSCRKRSFAHGFVGRHGDHVNGEHHAPVEIGQLQNHAVFDVAGVILEEQDATILIAHFEVVPMKFQTVRTDRVLEIMPALHRCLKIKRQG